MRRMGPKRRDWERHVQEALDVVRPIPDGVPGPDGVPDPDGVPGPDGVPDPDGVPGPDGVPDPDGVPGPDSVPDPLPPLPVREKITPPVHESDLHSDECPCRVCTTYQPHGIIGNWHPSKGPRAGLYLVTEDDGA